MASIKKGARVTRLGSLFFLASLLIGSAILRLATETGPAFAKEFSAPSAACPDDALKPMHKKSDEELELVLIALREREAKLDQRERQLEDLAYALEFTEQAVDRKLAALTDAEVELKNTLDLVTGAAEKDLERLTAMYEQMNPKDSSALFSEMAPKFAAGFLSRMKPDAAASVLSGMDANKAYSISVIMAGRNADLPKN